MSTINPKGKEIISVSTELAGKTLTLEVNRVGFRTTASVLVNYGDTVVLGTAQVGSRPIQLDYFPLSVDYEEKIYAAGKISGSRFIKREGRPSDEAILIGRLIDRHNQNLLKQLEVKTNRHRVGDRQCICWILDQAVSRSFTISSAILSIISSWPATVRRRPHSTSRSRTGIS